MNTHLPPKLLLSQLKHLPTKPKVILKEQSASKNPVSQPDSDIASPVLDDLDIPVAPVPGKIPAKSPDPTPAKPQETLPVLQAFQQFLDVERRRTKTRMVTLTLVFIAVFVVVAAMSLAVALTYTRQFRKDFLDMKDQVAVVQQDAQKVNSDTRTALQNFETEASKLQGDIQNISQSTTDIKSQTESYDGALTKLRDAVNSLATQNDSLRTDIARLKLASPNEPPALQYQSIQNASQQQLTQSDKGPSTIVVPIMPRGKTNAVAWRVPLPE
jgi:methyl-accepting chemotaxis protein